MTYTYKCQVCKEKFDVKHGMNESPIITHCGIVAKKFIAAPLGIHGANTGARKGT